MDENEVVIYDTWAVLEIQSKVPEHTVMIIDKVGQTRKIETVYHEVEK